MGKKKRLIYVWWMVLLFTLLSVEPVQAACFSKRAPVVTVRQNGTSVTFNWKKRTDLTGYQLFRTNASGGSRKWVRNIRGTVCTERRLTAGRTYYYRIRGYQKRNGRTQYTSFSRVLRVQVKKTALRSTSTLKKFLQTALKPVGTTMYVWGGGWNEEDNGAGKEARTIGVSPQWKRFFEQQDTSYDYTKTKYQISNGLDCSGFVGWCIYNIMNTRSGQEGYVMSAKDMAKNFAGRGWGTYIGRQAVKDYRPGDIMSSDCSDCGHVWIVLGECEDGSVVLVHSSVPGVRISGTPSRSGKTRSEAVKLAEYYMKKYYPSWYEKYPDCAKGSTYLTHYGQMRWDLSGQKMLSDPDGYENKSAEEVLRDLLGV